MHAMHHLAPQPAPRHPKPAPPSPARDQLLSLLAEHPGLTIMQAAQELGVARTTVRHHVRVLLKSGQVRAVRAGKVAALFAIGPQAAPLLRGRVQPGLAALNHPLRRSIWALAAEGASFGYAEYVAWTRGSETPGTSGPRWPVSPSVFAYHCAVMASLGLLVAQAVAPRRMWMASVRARERNDFGTSYPSAAGASAEALA